MPEKDTFNDLQGHIRSILHEAAFGSSNERSSLSVEELQLKKEHWTRKKNCGDFIKDIALIDRASITDLALTDIVYYFFKDPDYYSSRILNVTSKKIRPNDLKYTDLQGALYQRFLYLIIDNASYLELSKEKQKFYMFWLISSQYFHRNQAYRTVGAIQVFMRENLNAHFRNIGDRNFPQRSDRLMQWNAILFNLFYRESGMLRKDWKELVFELLHTEEQKEKHGDFLRKLFESIYRCNELCHVYRESIVDKNSCVFSLKSSDDFSSDAETPNNTFAEAIINSALNSVVGLAKMRGVPLESALLMFIARHYYANRTLAQNTKFTFKKIDYQFPTLFTEL